MVPEQDRRGAGFTLIEVIAVLLLTVVLAAVAVPRLMDSGVAVAAEAEVLRAHLRFAQSLAVSANTAGWSVLVAGQSYQLQRNGAASPIHFPGESSATHVLAGGVNVTGGTGALVFDAQGAPAATHVITLSDGTRTETVSVTGFTGLIP